VLTRKGARQLFFTGTHLEVGKGVAVFGRGRSGPSPQAVPLCP